MKGILNRDTIISYEIEIKCPLGDFKCIQINYGHNSSLNEI